MSFEAPARKPKPVQGPVVKLSPVVVRVLGHAARSYALTGMPDVMYLVGSGKSRLLIDAGEGRKEDLPLLMKAMEEVGCTKISDVLITHYHPTYNDGVEALKAYFGDDLRVWSLPWSTEIIGESFEKPMLSDSGSSSTQRVQVLEAGAALTTEDSRAKLTAAVQENIWKVEVLGKKGWLEATFAGTMKRSLVRSSRNLLKMTTKPTLEPKPEPQRKRDPDPEPEPTSEPEPKPKPEPQRKRDPDPEPEPTSEPEPKPKPEPQLTPDPEPPLTPEKSAQPLALLLLIRNSIGSNRSFGCQVLLLLLLLLLLLVSALQHGLYFSPSAGNMLAQSNTAPAIGTCPIKHLWYGCTRCVCPWNGLQDTDDLSQSMVLPSWPIKPYMAVRKWRLPETRLPNLWQWYCQHDYDGIAKAYFVVASVDRRGRMVKSRWFCPTPKSGGSYGRAAVHHSPKAGSMPAQSKTAIAVGTRRLAETTPLPSLPTEPRGTILQQRLPGTRLRWRWQPDYDHIAKAYFVVKGVQCDRRTAHCLQRGGITHSTDLTMQIVKRGLQGRL